MSESSRKSAESDRKGCRIITYHYESCPAVDGVAYRPGVYKILMVRMAGGSDELANVRV